MLGIFCNWVYYFFVYISEKPETELKCLLILSCKFWNEEAPRTGSMDYPVLSEQASEKMKSMKRLFFYEKKIIFFRQNIIESHHLKKILMIHHKLCEIWRKNFLFSGLRLTNHREWHQNIKVSSTFLNFCLLIKTFEETDFPTQIYNILKKYLNEHQKLNYNI